jgi:hypothetical protein
MISSYNHSDNMGSQMTWKALLAAAAMLTAQQPGVPPDTPPPVAPGGVFRLPPAYEPPKEAEPPKVEETKEVVLENTGSPIKIPFTCTDDDIVAFGMACSDEAPCPVFAELTAVLPLGSRIFITGNLHDSQVTMYSLMLASQDAGKTWTEPVERIRGVGLDQIQFYDFETGWISGQSLGALPKDPFFLLTTDGGKIWRKSPIFSETRFGVIEKYWFDSRTAGSLVIDRMQGAEASARYELYESMTGGESWMIRQVGGKPYTLKGVRDTESATGWRLRADAKTKSYVVEKREGTRRVGVASFLIGAGECKPAASPLIEPPAPSALEAGETKPAPRGPSRPPTLKKP